MKEVVTDYLWDRSGAPDPEVEQLEGLLSTLQYQSRPLSIPEQVQRSAETMNAESGTGVDMRQQAHPARWLTAGRWSLAAAVAAAAVLIVLGLAIRSRFEWRPGEPWQVAALTGAPRIVGTPQRTRLAVGDVLETDAASRARLRIASIGVLYVEPNSRLRLLATRTRHHRVALDFGTIDARLWAPPFSFGVQTPSSMALDLGCAFRLHVNPSGYGLLHVTSGWVALQSDGFQTIIPAEGEAITRPGFGPGTVYFPDARNEFKEALAEFDTKGDDPVVRAHAVRTIIATARSHDAITLLTLLRKLPAEDRGLVLDRLTEFVPIPAGFGREDVLELHVNAIDAYWNALGLGNSKSWVLNWKDSLFD